MQGGENGTTVGVIAIVVGVFVSLVGSYVLFIISSFREKMKDCKEHCTGRIESAIADQAKTNDVIFTRIRDSEGKHDELLKVVYKIQGAIE